MKNIYGATVTQCIHILVLYIQYVLYIPNELPFCTPLGLVAGCACPHLALLSLLAEELAVGGALLGLGVGDRVAAGAGGGRGESPAFLVAGSRGWKWEAKQGCRIGKKIRA